jgi:hypothetical protein
MPPAGLLRRTAPTPTRTPRRPASWEGLSAQFLLPTGVSYIKGSATGFKPRLSAPVYDSAAGTVMWEDLPTLSGKATRRFTAVLSVSHTVSSGTVLPIDAYLYEMGTLCMYYGPHHPTVRQDAF